ncbi:MAG: hypothetical protein ABIO58_07005, partial [Luteimonas sp.]
AMLVGCGLIASAVAASGPATEAIVGKSLDLAPESRMEGNQAIDDATAAALIGAISSQFGERTVQVKLDKVDVAPAGIIQRDIHGVGRLLIGNDDAWIPFRFDALYDTEQASVSYPDLTLGGDEAGQPVSADSAMARQLTAEVDRRLREEFAQQPARIALDTVRLVQAGKRYVRLEASGTADFGREGATAAGVQALYDVRSGDWLRVSYELGATTNRSALPDAVATR